MTHTGIHEYTPTPPHPHPHPHPPLTSVCTQSVDRAARRSGALTRARMNTNRRAVMAGLMLARHILYTFVKIRKIIINIFF
jgi:hypothetical protein